jgi:transcription initiation factor TFIIIB Brf1 subunit/transcription initiation factor TFIIB
MHTTVIQKSIEIFQNVKTNKKLKGRSMDTILATMIFMATRYHTQNYFRIEKKPVIISDIENVSNSSKEDIRKCFNIVKRLVPEIVSAPPSYYVETFAGKLDLKFEVSRTSKEIAEKISELGIILTKNRNCGW